MADSEVEIANRALIQVGEGTIVSMEDDNDRARTISVLYNTSRDAVLASHPWNEATARAVLSPIADDTPEWGFTNTFQLPADFIRLMELEDMRDRFKVEGDKILANIDIVNIIYVFRLKDPVKMRPLLADAIAGRLAFEICMSVRGDPQQAKEYYAVFLDKLNEARYIDAQQAPVHVYGGSGWFDARFVGPTGFADSYFRPIASG